MGKRRKVGVFFAALIVAIGGIIYELIIATASSYLVGNSVLQFSLTIGLFLFGMGIGSFVAPYLQNPAEEKFILIEALLALIGGNSVLILFSSFAYTEWFRLSQISLILVIGVLIGLEIPMMLKILKRGERSDLFKITSWILSLDYIGALIASIAFPLFLLPYLGILRTSYLVGILNLAISFLLYFSFRERIIKKRLIKVLLLAGLVILFAGLTRSNVIAWRLDHKLYDDEVIYSAQSPYQKIVVTRFKDDIRLYLNGDIQFSSIDEHRYHEPLVHIPMNLVKDREKILVLGGGDGLAVREILKYADVGKIVVVDIDKMVTDLATNYPLLRKLNGGSLKNAKVEIVNQDAFSFIQESSVIYNVIIADFPDPNNETLAKLYSREFYSLIEKLLAADGVFVTQATSPYFATNTFWIINQTIDDAGLITYPFHSYVPAFGQWGFVMAAKISLKPNYITIPVSTKFLKKEIIPSLFIFDEDFLPDKEKMAVNTLYNPVIIKVYEQDGRRWQP